MRPGAGPLLRLAPAITLLLMLGPVGAGLVGTVLPAFGYLPAIGGHALTLAPFRALLAEPGLAMSAALSLGTGLVSTLVAFLVVVLFTARFEGTRWFALMRRGLSPVLAVPHAAAALALAVLIAPSGFVLRLLSPWATGLERPPDILLIGDPAGVTLTAALVIKEMPFLFLMLIAALPQSDSRRSRQIAASLGYRPIAAWLKTVLPRVYPQIRLPVFAVLAYSTSVVDMALILGPSTPAPLAVRLVGWMNDPDLSRRFLASAGALLQLALAATAIAIWIAGERIAARLGRRAIASGRRGLAEAPLGAAAALAAGLGLAALSAGIVVLGLWSVAGPWRFPDALPDSLTLAAWSRHLPHLAGTVATTLAIALAAAAIALVLVLACLEGEARRGRSLSHRTLPLVYLPLLVPQVAFLFGLQVLLLSAGLQDSVAAVTLTHLVYVLPYVFLALSDPWRAVDPRFAQVATALGARPTRVFWRVRLPLVTRAVATAAALACAVSFAQYLPTLLIGGGRVTTVTTEAVALAFGGNRQVMAVHAVLQTALPLAAFLLAALVSGALLRNRSDLAAG